MCESCPSRSKDSEKSGTSDEREADPLSPEETVDSPHDRLKIVEVDEEDDGDDQWEDEELNDQIDKEANSQSIRLTARNVKTIIKASYYEYFTFFKTLIILFQKIDFREQVILRNTRRHSNHDFFFLNTDLITHTALRKKITIY